MHQQMRRKKEEFYEQLGCILMHMYIVMGDFNAKVGTENKNSKGEMGKHGLREKNNNGEKVLQMCSEYDLVITETLFQHRNIHKAT